MKKPVLNQTEIRQTMTIAAIFASRMLGLFIIFPVFSVYVLSGAYGQVSALAMGIAMGIYGLTQASLQIPFGLLSDYYGRKKMIFIGLMLFLLGSLIAGVAENISTLIIGRALQGSGAVSAVLLALLADLTPPAKRLRTMAIIGMSIGASFMLSFLIGPILYKAISLPGLFFVTAGLAIIGLLILGSIPEPAQQKQHLENTVSLKHFKQVAQDTQLLRLDFGIFALHASITALFIAIPFLLMKHFNMPLAEHWMVYLPVLILSVLLMVPCIIIAEKTGRIKLIFTLSIGLLVISQMGLFATQNGFIGFMVFLVLFFTAFNFLEASLPSLVSLIASPRQRGTAMGIYSSSQFLGSFAGGALGGLLFTYYDVSGIFIGSACLGMLWLLVCYKQALGRGKTIILEAPVQHLKGSFADIEQIALNQPGVLEAVAVESESIVYLKVEKAFKIDALNQALFVDQYLNDQLND